MPLVRYEVTGYGIALYGMTVEHCRMMGALLKWLTRVAWVPNVARHGSVRDPPG